MYAIIIVLILLVGMLSLVSYSQHKEKKRFRTLLIDRSLDLHKKTLESELYKSSSETYQQWWRLACEERDDAMVNLRMVLKAKPSSVTNVEVEIGRNGVHYQFVSEQNQGVNEIRIVGSDG